jgi:hypothetical protein
VDQVMMLLALESAEVTQIPQRILLTAVMVIAIVLAVYGIRRSWRKKAIGQADIPAPNSVPIDFIAEQTFAGRYLASTYANDWLKRIVVHGLGAPSRVVVEVSELGIRMNFNQTREIFIPAEDISQVRADRAIAGRAFEKDGIAVILWKLGTAEIASGFRADTNEDHARFLEMTISKQESGK